MDLRRKAGTETKFALNTDLKEVQLKALKCFFYKRSEAVIKINFQV